MNVAPPVDNQDDLQAPPDKSEDRGPNETGQEPHGGVSDASNRNSADRLNREFAAKSPGARKGGRNPWVLVSLLIACAGAMYFVMSLDKPSKKSLDEDKPAVYEMAKPRAKIVPGREEESPKPEFLETESYGTTPAAPTRADLEREKQLEEKRRQAEALRLARIKSAIVIAGGQGAQFSSAASFLTAAGAGSMATDGNPGAVSAPHGGDSIVLSTAGANGPPSMEHVGRNFVGVEASRAREDVSSSDPNERFFAEKSGRGRASVHAIQLGNLGFTVLQGKLIDCVLETAIQSDLPGQLRCSTSNDVYAEAGRGVMLPSKTRMIGQYNSAVRKGQVRVFVIWQRAITPSGVDVQLDSPGTDPLGRAGLGGEVDNHYLEIFGVSAMLSIIGAGASSYGVGGLDQPNSESAYRQAIQQSFAQTAQQILSPYAQIAPTIHVNQGEAIKIFVNRDLDFSNVYAERAESKRPSYTEIQ